MMARVPEPGKTAARLRSLTSLRPTLAIVLGSGFGPLAEVVAVNAQISYSDLSGFRPARVAGHYGELLFATVAGVPLLVLSGRAHYYEGHSMAEITFPIRVLAAFGIRAVLLTCAGGGINRRYRPGDFMLFADHLNFMGASPLRGSGSKDQSRFVDLTRAYDLALNRLLKKAARAARARMHTGVYLAVSGPNYETPAEIRAFSRLGADAVGMSTVPEVIVARQCGLAVAAVACITNPAASRRAPGLSHSAILAQAAQVTRKAAGWMTRFVDLYARESALAGS